MFSRLRRGTTPGGQTDRCVGHRLAADWTGRQGWLGKTSRPFSQFFPGKTRKAGKKYVYPGKYREKLGKTYRAGEKL